MRTFWRVVAVIVLALYGFAATLPDLAILWHPFGTYGLTTDVEDRVRSVAPGSVAAAAGIVPGDTVTGLGAASLPEVWVARPGIVRVVTVTHDGVSREATLRAEPTRLPSGGMIVFPLRKILGALFIIAGIFLVLGRPSPATWGFFLYCVGANPFEGWYLLGASLPPKVFLACSLVDDVMNAAGIVGLLTFALYFPRSDVAGWRARAQRRIPLIFACTAILNLAVDLASWYAKPPQWFVTSEEVWFDILFLTTAAIFVETYLRTRGEDRKRVAWTSFGMIVGMVGLAVADIYGLFTWSVFSTASWVERISSMLVGAVPITIIYAAIRHRVLDFSFAVNRTIVYGLMTSLVVIAFSLLHSFAIRTLAGTKFGTLTELLAAVAIGFWLQAIHERVSSFVDAVFFRRRRSTRKRLERAAEAIEYATSAAAVDDIMVNEPKESLGLASSAVFRVAGGIEPDAAGRQRFARRKAIGWDEAACRELGPDDMLVLQLEAQRKPLLLADLSWPRHDLPTGNAAPQYAVPIVSRRYLVGIALFSAHASGNDLDPDEVDLICVLARAAAQAYERLDAQELRRLLRERTSGDWRAAAT
ncbi:MAG TPA: hypothetical protein VEJ41_06405 [Candidatus Acidoferrales bacterium]|nr:hypothetical protein [Candidatus Acidoferrales bacterium]